MGRLQDERSAETRKRLLDATVECLFERGYAGTTTAEIAARAGVSKGAQMHHFPTKHDLVVSALEYLFELRLAASTDPEAIRKLPTERIARLGAIIEMLIPVYQGKVFYAWLELAVASRTDVALRDAVRRLSESFSNKIAGVWKDLFGSPGDDPAQFRALDRLVNGQFAATALGLILLGDQAGAAEIEENAKLLNEVGAFLLHRKHSRRSTP